MTRVMIRLAIFFWLAAMVAGRAGAVEYRMLTLGAAGAVPSQANDINDAGVVVGYYTLASGVKQAFVWERYLGVRDLNAFSEGHDSEARLINNSGQIIGESVGSDFQPRSCSWIDGVPQDMMVEGYSFHDINDTGLIVGRRVTACTWQYGVPAGPPVALETESSNAWGINDSGQIVGSSGLDGDAWHAVLWDGGAEHRDLGVLPGDSQSEARAINDVGQVVGISYEGQNTHAFIWNDGTGIDDLPLLPGGVLSEAYGINNGGQSVGCITVTDGSTHAVLWNADSVVDLGALASGTYSKAWSINSCGQVAGMAVVNGISRAVIWEPVPEPSSLAVLIGGVAGAICTFRRRTR